MKPASLYQTLKVRKTASKEAIQAAHRRRVLETHPDRGGDREEFERVHLAGRVLLDDAARQRYDETGEINGPAPDNSRAQAIAVLSQVFGVVLSELRNNGADPAQEDLVWLMRKRINEAIAELSSQQEQLAKAKAALEAMLGRFEGDGGIMEGILQLQIQGFVMPLENTARALAINNRVLELLAFAKYRFDSKSQYSQTVSPVSSFDEMRMALEGCQVFSVRRPVR